MKTSARLLGFLFAVVGAQAAPVSLFDGRTLDAWEGDAKLWRVEEGEIRGGSLTEQVTHNDFLATKKSYSNFDLRMKLRLNGTGFVNSGIQIRSLRVPGSPEMSGYQVDYGKGWYGKLYDESRRKRVVGESKDLTAANAAIKEGEWNEYRVRAEGARIQSWINGVPALDYTEDDLNIAQDGHIGIQIHGGGKALVQVKDVTIEELPATQDAPTWEKLGGVEAVRAKIAPPKQGAAAPSPKVKPMKQGNAANSMPKTPEEERATFKLPEGFEIELVAAEDPANGIGKFVPIAFDQRGALWTTTALEYPVDGNENPAAADALYASKAKDKVLIYDRDLKLPTGYASKPRVFAEGLAIPLGVLPYKNGCYVQHGHDIAFLEDTDGDGKADKRTVILTGFGVQDSHLFPHQFMRAPGGWIWMAQGAFNYGKVSRPGDEKNAVQFDQTRMAKFRPDGSQFTITSNGPCNIWGLVLTGEGEAFIQEANDFGYPVMPFYEYANYPGCSDRQWKSYAPEFPGTAPDFKMGGTGLSGLALTDKSGPFPEPWRDVMLVANPITNRIQGIKMHRDGPRWRLDKPVDFLVSEDPWFRPVAISIGPDGCLYIVDWYNKIISHNEVPRNHPDRDKTRGRIWRVKAKAAKPFDVPDFTKLSGDELIAKLGGPSLAQHHLAWQAIVDRDMKEIAPKLQEIVLGVGWAFRLPADASRVGNANSEPRANANARSKVPGETPGTAGGTPTLPDAARIAALWVLEEIERADLGILRTLMTDGNRNIRREASTAIDFLDGDLGGSPGERINLLNVLRDERDPVVRAQTICTLGGIVSQATFWEGKPTPWPESAKPDLAVSAILQFSRVPLAAPVAPSTRNGKPIKVREAYDREFERYLVRMFLERHPDAVAKFLDSDDAKPLSVEARLLASLALEPKASAARVAKLLPQLKRPPEKEEILRLVQFLDEPGVSDAVKATLANPATASAVLNTLLELRSKLDPARLAPLVAESATKLLASKDAAQVETGVRLAGAFKVTALEGELAAVVTRTILSADPAAARAGLPALRALGELGSANTDLFARIVGGASDPEVRDEALAALAASKAADAAQRVLGLYSKLAPQQRRIALDKLTTHKSGARAIVAAVTGGVFPKGDIDAGALDRMLAVLGDKDAALNSLVESLGTLFRPVLALDGTDDAYAETGLTLEGPLTVETWVKLDPGIGNADGILGAAGQLDLNFFGGQFRVWAGAALHDVVVAKKKIVPDMWMHVAATRDATGIWKLYIDGELNATGTKPAAHKIANVKIGATGARGGTKGQLVEFRIWNRERTADEIRANFDRSVAAEVSRPARAGEISPPPSVGGYEGVVFNSASGWRKLGGGARIVKTSDLPPVLSAEAAVELDAKFSKYRSLAGKPGDVARGKMVVLVCQACHLFGTTGGQIGPNLSGVGAMGAEAILRNILTPNAAMESAYRIYRVEQRDGSVLDAFYVSEDKDAVVVRLPGADDRRIARKDIVRTQFLRRSLMPEGLLEGMSEQQVSDLFAYLLSLK